jgi:hypothetical protein
MLNRSGIGVQQIVPRGGADWQHGRHPPERRDDTEHDDAASPEETRRAPPLPGTGKIVDRSV